MINLIKMNIYKLCHTKSMAVILGIALAMVGFIYYADYKLIPSDYSVIQDYGSLEEEEVENLQAYGCSDELIAFIAQCDISDEVSEELLSGEISDETIRDFEELYNASSSNDDEIIIGISSSVSDKENITIMDQIIGEYTSGIILIFLSIATVLFVNADEKNGYIKNIVGQSEHKSYIYLSKIMVMSVYALVFMLIYGLTVFIVGKLFADDIKFIYDNAAVAAGKAGIAYLITIAYISGVAMLASIMRGASFAMVMGIIFPLGFELLVFSNIDILLDTHIYDYAPVNVLSILCDATSKNEYIRAILVGAVLFIGYNGIGACVIEKRDAA